mmetsp:Transcript_2290/g.5073  ORF Transcript_2290/g.5073 Transcript_2290/m.5073 type:complete len:329 (-) Transcript_2290:654-1640(-)
MDRQLFDGAGRIVALDNASLALSLTSQYSVLAACALACLLGCTPDIQSPTAPPMHRPQIAPSRWARDIPPSTLLCQPARLARQVRADGEAGCDAIFRAADGRLEHAARVLPRVATQEHVHSVAGGRLEVVAQDQHGAVVVAIVGDDRSEEDADGGPGELDPVVGHLAVDVQQIERGAILEVEPDALADTNARGAIGRLAHGPLGIRKAPREERAELARVEDGADAGGARAHDVQPRLQEAHELEAPRRADPAVLRRLVAIVDRHVDDTAVERHLVRIRTADLHQHVVGAAAKVEASKLPVEDVCGDPTAGGRGPANPEGRRATPGLVP